MSFIADKQTMEDLNLPGKYKNNSIFNLFNQAVTAGGERLLEQMFHNPLNDADQINRRSTTFQYFQSRQLVFPFSAEEFSTMENYLGSDAGSNLVQIGVNTVKKKVLGVLIKDEAYEKTLSGIEATVSIICLCRTFMDNFKDLTTDHPYQKQVRAVQLILSDQRLDSVRYVQQAAKPGLSQVIHFEKLFRLQLREEMEALLEFIYQIDVYISVGNLAALRSFSYAHALPKADNRVSAEELRHPALEKGVGNSISFHQQSNLIFLTGANMAGKSTLMKSFGIAFYLAHIGFPIAAKNMVFSVKDGIYSSINVPDNLNMGLSHFYAEVLRVKKVAEEVSEGKDLLVIFDELFKGTNVKDAYDATLAVTEAFSRYRNCLFIISTHIIEVGDALLKHEHLQFLYLPTEMDGNVPRYTYKLQKGITSDRQGMMIIENEGILDILS